jgi:DNA mismatch repair ATPase MutS
MAHGAFRLRSILLHDPRSFYRSFSALRLINGRPRLKFAPPFPVFCRHAGTKLRKSLDELPQGLQAPFEPFVEREASKYSPVIDEVLQNQRRFPKCVLLTRLGQFYEVLTPERVNTNSLSKLYFQQAEEIAPLLNIKLAAKQTRLGPISMAGFPFFQLDRYLKVLVEDHQKYVALCEEYRKHVDDTSSKLEFERRVVRIITPGTLIDERFMDPYENNFLLAVYTPDATAIREGLEPEDVGLAWLDLSTGDFYTQSTETSSLPGDVARIAPREILLNEDLRSDRSHALFSTIEEEKHFISYEPFTDLGLTSIPASWETLLESPIPARVAKEFSLLEIRAAEVLLRSVKGKLLGTNMRIQPPIRKSKQDIMLIDANTSRALEIKRSMREGNIKGSLLSSIRRTVTKSGARLFADMICMHLRRKS